MFAIISCSKLTHRMIYRVIWLLNIENSFNHNIHHMSELYYLCTEGLLLDETVEFKSF